MLMNYNSIVFCYYRGNVIIVGSQGHPLRTMAQLALYIAGYPIHHLDDGCGHAGFRECLRSLFRATGLEGKPVSIILNVRLSNVLKCTNHEFLYNNGSLYKYCKHCTCGPSIA